MRVVDVATGPGRFSIVYGWTLRISSMGRGCLNNGRIREIAMAGCRRVAMPDGRKADNQMPNTTKDDGYRR